MQGHQHLPPAAWCPASLWAVATSQSCLLLGIFIVDYDIISMQYSFGQLRSAVLVVSHPNFLPTPWPACWERECGGKKNQPSYCAGTSQHQPKHGCVLSTTSIRNSKHSSTGTAMKKINLMSGRPSKLLQLPDYIWTFWTSFLFFHQHIYPHDSGIHRL